MSYCIYASTQRILDQFRNHLHLKYLHNFYMLSSKVQQIGGSSGLTKEQWKSIWLVMKPLDLSFATATQLLETLQQVGNDLEDLISDISIILHVDTLKLILAEEGTCPMPLYLIDAICGYLDCKLNHQVGRGEIRAAIFNMFENQPKAEHHAGVVPVVSTHEARDDQILKASQRAAIIVRQNPVVRFNGIDNVDKYLKFRFELNSIIEVIPAPSTMVYLEVLCSYLSDRPAAVARSTIVSQNLYSVGPRAALDTVWCALDAAYHTPEADRYVSSLLTSIKQNINEPVQSYLARFSTVVAMQRAPISDLDKIVKFTSGLTEQVSIMARGLTDAHRIENFDQYTLVFLNLHRSLAPFRTEHRAIHVNAVGAPSRSSGNSFCTRCGDSHHAVEECTRVVKYPCGRCQSNEHYTRACPKPDTRPARHGRRDDGPRNSSQRPHGVPFRGSQSKSNLDQSKSNPDHKPSSIATSGNAGAQRTSDDSIHDELIGVGCSAVTVPGPVFLSSISVSPTSEVGSCTLSNEPDHFFRELTGRDSPVASFCSAINIASVQGAPLMSELIDSSPPMISLHSTASVEPTVINGLRDTGAAASFMSLECAKQYLQSGVYRKEDVSRIPPFKVVYGNGETEEISTYVRMKVTLEHDRNFPHDISVFVSRSCSPSFIVGRPALRALGLLGVSSDAGTRDVTVPMELMSVSHSMPPTVVRENLVERLASTIQIRFPLLERAYVAPYRAQRRARTWTDNHIIVSRLEALVSQQKIEKCSVEECHCVNEIVLVDKLKVRPRPPRVFPSDELDARYRITLDLRVVNHLDLVDFGGSHYGYVPNVGALRMKITRSQFDRQSQPAITDLLQRCQASKYTHYVKIDVSDAFQSILIPTALRGLFSYQSHTGQCYRWRTLPQGWKWSPIYFNTAMAYVLDQARCEMDKEPFLGGNYSMCQYVDDLLIATTSRSAAETALKIVRHCLMACSFKTNLSKCDIAESVTFCGYDISSHGVKPIVKSGITELAIAAAWDHYTKATSAEKRKVMLKWCGLFNYFRNFIPPNLQSALHFLYRLTVKNCDSSQWEAAGVREAFFSLSDQLLLGFPRLHFGMPDHLVASLVVVDANAAAWSGILFRVVKCSPRPTRDRRVLGIIDELTATATDGNDDRWLVVEEITKKFQDRRFDGRELVPVDSEAFTDGLSRLAESLSELLRGRQLGGPSTTSVAPSG